jgi:hypothetical protein
MPAAPAVVERHSQFKIYFCNILLSPAVKLAGLFIFILWREQ